MNSKSYSTKKSQVGVQTAYTNTRFQSHNVTNIKNSNDNDQFDTKQQKQSYQHKKSSFQLFNKNYSLFSGKKNPTKSDYKSRCKKIDTRLKNIMQKYEKKKEIIQLLIHYKENQDQEEISKYNFQPKINHNPRYPITNRLQQRNKSWDEARAKRFTSIREQIVQKQVKECTFQPNLISKQKNKYIMQNKMIKMQRQKQRQDKNMIQNKFIKINNRILNVDEKKLVKKDYNMIYNDIKHMIRLEMNKIDFPF